ncbi:MAG: cation:proton antiporter [Devosia nanyangense]|uniref:Cation:proton antiporter n=1 Tax=Devosia nanyangense TaxID=1228055 RepID=A0A933L3H0_9HYPH|nr:cation:proton antiporter [Devosia nanyangense]
MAGNPLFAVLVLLIVAVALVPVFKWLGLGTVLGYLAAGVVVGPYGLRLISDTETIRTVSDFGVVIMLFLIGLEVHPLELWRLRHKVLGLGVTQLIGTAAIIATAVLLLGTGWQASLIIGLSLAMSSTAIAMQSVGQRSITMTDTGRATLVTLLVQDMAVIPVLALIPVLAATRRVQQSLGADLADAADVVTNPYSWWIALVIIGGFVAVTLASRYLMNPLMRWVATAKVPEAFTALGLLIVIGAAFATESLGLSPALGAFLGGVLLADSEYRHELESNLEPFKGLLLGLFFITVGMGIAFSVLLAQPLKVLSLVAVIIGIKIVVLYVLGTFFKMHVADRLLLAILLSQAGEFAFVLLQFAQSAAILSSKEHQLWAVVVALSMALTPVLLLLFDRLVVPKLNARAPLPDIPSDLPGGRSVIVLGYGRFGQIVTRLLRAQGYSMTLIDDDPAQIELVKRFGVKVFYGDGARLDILRAAGAADAQMIVIAVAGGDRILAIAEMIRRHFPQVKIAARAIDRSHAHQLMALDVEVFERETFRAATTLGEKALVALGRPPDEARRLAAAFESHDERLLRDSYELRDDRDAYVGFVRRSTEMLDKVMQADRAEAEARKDSKAAE